MPPKSSEDTKLKEKHCRNQLAALFAEVRQKVGSEGLLRCIKRDTVASAQLPFEDVTLSFPYAGS